MATAAEISGQIRILETVAEFVDDEVIERVFGFSRVNLRRLLEEGVESVLLPLVEKGWEALLADPNLVTIPPSLLAVADRPTVARHLALLLARAPYYTGTKKSTALAHRMTANAALTRAAYYRFEQATIDKVVRLGEALYRRLASSGEAMAQDVIADIGSVNSFRRKGVLRGYRDGTRGQRHAARMDDALREWRIAYVETIRRHAEQGRRLGMQRAIDTLYHFEDARNPWSKISQPLSAMELGGVFFTHRHHVLPIAAEKVLVEARGLSAKIRRDMLDIITEDVFLLGKNPKAAAKRILAKYRDQLGKRWGGAKVSAERIARTESAYILNEATRIAYEEAGVGWVDVIYSEGRWPCDICPPIAESGPHPIDRIPEGGIPFHPN